jgi:hypothetical protein
MRNRLSFKDHAAVNHEHSASLDRLHRVRKLDSVSVRLLHLARPRERKGHVLMGVYPRDGIRVE